MARARAGAEKSMIPDYVNVRITDQSDNLVNCGPG
jgi:hypothetical protein